ncbi:MAG: WG repeat-containing protein [Pedobacter sp.]|uniref:WG repeat-containing protein n=1 Tax=Pedobacter sp. TaxID=1411316 RepID=UPI002807D373|nr:WG repeat-containing protein [Pedobacter sp.]MDQ8005449.1 WG repeat-containing protein [Pedobacter sp.]
MNKRLTLTVILIGFSSLVLAQNYRAFEDLKSGKWGFEDPLNGKVVIQPKYQFAYSFTEGLASVQLNNLWGYVNAKGEEIIPFKLTFAGSFTNGSASVTDENYQSYHIDKTGKPLYLEKYEVVFEFFEGLAAAKKNEAWGYIDKTGKTIIPFNFDDAGNFKYGKAIVGLGGAEKKFGVINKQGKILVPITSNSKPYFSEGLAFIDDAKKVIVDTLGKVAFPVNQYTFVYPFREGMAVTDKSEQEGIKLLGYINKQGKVLVPSIYDEAADFYEGMGSVAKNGKFGFVNKLGKLAISLQYEASHSFDGGLAAVQKVGKWGYIDKNGKVIIPFQFQTPGFFYEGLAAVEKDGKYGFINKLGKMLIPFQYDDVEYSFRNGVARVVKDGEAFYINNKGQRL